jgi:hypothetical protein
VLAKVCRRTQRERLMVPLCSHPPRYVPYLKPNFIDDTRCRANSLTSDEPLEAGAVKHVRAKDLRQGPARNVLDDRSEQDVVRARVFRLAAGAGG